MAAHSILKEDVVQRIRDAVERSSPLTLDELFKRAAHKLTPAAVQELAKTTATCVFLGNLKAPSAVLGLAVVGKAGAEQATLQSDALLVSLLGIRATRSSRTRAHTPEKLGNILPKQHRAAFKQAIEQRIAAQRWPDGVGYLRSENCDLLFFLDHVQRSQGGSAENGRGAPAEASREGGAH